MEDRELNCAEFNCPKFADFEEKPVADDSWFKRQACGGSDKFLRTVDLNKIENSQRKVGNGSYCEIAQSYENKSQRKSHPMRTRQDVRMSIESDSQDLKSSAKNKILKKNKSENTQPSRITTMSEKMQPVTNACGGAYETMAEKLVKYFHKTPDRYRNSKCRKPDYGNHQPIPNTRPITPQFETNKRIRGTVNVKSAEQREEEELEAMKSAQFKANPINRGVLGRSASCNQADRTGHRSKAEIAKAVVTRLAVPKGRRNASLNECDERPSNKMAQKRCQRGTTIPQSPKLETKKRAFAHPDSENAVQNNAVSKSDGFYHPAPNFDHAFRPKLRHQATKPQPFSFDSRDREKAQLKEIRIQEKLNEELLVNSQFRAQPLPSDSPDELPQKKSRPPTQPMEFVLQCDKRGQKYQSIFQRDKEEIEQKKRHITKFKARPPDVLQKDPFQPTVPSRTIESAASPDLATKARAECRRNFEAEQLSRNKLLEDEKAKEAEEREKCEILEMMNQRNQALHRAQPVRHFKAVEIRRSSKSPTVPRSPKFSKRFNK